MKLCICRSLYQGNGHYEDEVGRSAERLQSTQEEIRCIDVTVSINPEEDNRGRSYTKLRHAKT